MASSDRILVSVPAELMARLESWEENQAVPPPRSQTLRAALEWWLDEQPCVACEMLELHNDARGWTHTCEREGGS